MNVVVIFVITLLTTVGVLCASVSSVKMAQWQSGSDMRQEKRDDQRLLESSLLDGRGSRLKRNSDGIRVYKDALFTSPNTAYLQKHQTHRLRCPSWRHGERLSSTFWFNGSTLVAKFVALNKPGTNFTDGERYQLDDKMGLIIQNVTDDDGGLYDCRVVPTATEKERKGMVTIEILDSTFPGDDVSMVPITMKQKNINRQNSGRIKCPHSTTDAAATYWSLDKGEGIDTDIIGAEYSNNDTLVLDEFKEDYQIASGGDLEILSLQRPQSRFWCHRFQDGSMVVGYIDVTGVVVVNQDQLIITGCEKRPGDDCQVNFDPDKDLQLNCSTRKVYPKVILAWKEVSKCNATFQEESFQKFDDVSKTYDQYHQLTVKARSFAADCQPKFVCIVIANGVDIGVQLVSDKAIQVKSVFTNQNQPIITGCENLPGDDCQVNFDPDKDIQLTCSVLKVYPKATLDWIVLSKCVINLQEESLESFDDVSKTYDQYQQLTVKAGSFAADCQPKFVCNATGVAIPVQPFTAEVILQVKSGVLWIVGLLFAVFFVIMIVMLCLLWRKGCFAKNMDASSSNIEGYPIQVADAAVADDQNCDINRYPIQVADAVVADDQKCDINNDERAVKSDTQEHDAKQQPYDDEKAVEPTTLEHEAKQQSCDEGRTLLSQPSQSDELEPADKEHVETHLSDASLSPLIKLLVPTREVVFHTEKHAGHLTPRRNRPKQDPKGGTTYQTVCMETELFSAGQHNLEIQMPENSCSPPLSNPQENDPQQMSFSGVGCEHLQEGEQQPQLDDVLPQSQVSDEANSDSHLTQVEVNRLQEDPPEISISEAACELPRKVVPQQDVNELQPRQHISDKANSDPHPVNHQQEDSPEISISEDEAGPSDPLLGAPSETMTSTASDARGHKQSTATSKDLQEENQRSNGPGPSPDGLGNNSPKRGKSDGESPMKESKKKKETIKIKESSG